jgi:RNA polymerase sigma-70 factor, ECF subfamily
MDLSGSGGRILRVDCVRSSAVAMTGDSPAAFVPAASRPALLARADPGSRRQERRLVREVQRGSAAALEELFRREWPRAYRAAYLVVHDAGAAEDIAQEAFLAAVRAIDRFDRRRPFGPWLHRIVVNRAIDATRARSLRREVDAAAAESAEAPLDPPSAPFSDDVVSALGALSPEHRAVVVLRYLFDYRPGEIARALDMPRGTVNSRLRRALDRLGEVIER